ncbi:MAG TPA: MFS transporter [Solirubrobacteraceae bacterium]|nr:MFS transporter [Solirubrobacteraceae bacterium]
MRRLGPALGVRDFSRLWLGVLGWDLSLQMVELVIGWQVYVYHHNALYLGLIGLAEFIPMLLLSLPAGHLADRHSRRLILASALCLSAIVAGALAAMSSAGVHSLWPFLALALCAGISMALGSPASRSLPPVLVPPRLLENAVTLRNASMYTSTMVGPALGGLLYPISPSLTYGVAAVVMLVGAGSVLTIHHREEPGRDDGSAADRRSVLAGLRFIKETQILFGAILLDLLGVLFGGAIALLPLYASSILHVNTVGLGFLRAAPSVGALGAAVVITRTQIGRHAGRKLLIAVGAFGAFTVVFGLSRTFWLSLIALAGTGFADLFSMNIRGTTSALATPDEVRGRVTAVEMVFISASNELGSFESGLAAFLVGAVPAVVAGGVITMALAVAWKRLFPDLAKLDRISEVAPPARSEPVVA